MIFISYSRDDHNKITFLLRKLKSRGYKYWQDTREHIGGDEWGERTVRAIKESEVVIIIISKKTKTSKYVPKETNIAYENKKTIIPVLLEDCKIPDKMLFALTGLQHIKLFPDDDKGTDEVIKALKKLGVKKDDYKPDRPPIKIRRQSNIGTHALGILSGVSLGVMFGMLIKVILSDLKVLDSVSYNTFALISLLLGMLIFWPLIYKSSVAPPLNRPRPAIPRFFINMGGFLFFLIFTFCCILIGELIEEKIGWNSSDLLSSLGAFIGGIIAIILAFKLYSD